MLIKQSWLHLSDNTNVEWLQIFHLYKGFHRRRTTVGFFVKGSAKVIEPPRFEYKGFKFKFNKKGDICRAILVRCTFPLRRADGSSVLFSSNEGVMIKKKQNIKSKYVQGLSTYHLKRKRFKTVFPQII